MRRAAVSVERVNPDEPIPAFVEELAAFDALPPALRARIREAAPPISAINVYNRQIGSLLRTRHAANDYIKWVIADYHAFHERITNAALAEGLDPVKMLAYIDNAERQARKERRRGPHARKVARKDHSRRSRAE
jgi:hypothetical protein